MRTVSRGDMARLSSLLPQELRRPHIKVCDLVAYGRTPHLGFGAPLCDADLSIIDRAVSSASLSDIRECYLDRISGGELRRAYFGMILAQNTDLVLLDEATAFMDAEFERRFFEMQKELSREKTVISVVHNLSSALNFADNILLVDGGAQMFFGTPSQLLNTDLVERIFSVKRFEADGSVFFA